jgi:hypothetical protein
MAITEDLVMPPLAIRGITFPEVDFDVDLIPNLRPDPMVLRYYLVPK